MLDYLRMFAEDLPFQQDFLRCDASILLNLGRYIGSRGF